MSTYILHIDKQHKQLMKEIQKLVLEAHGEIEVVKGTSLEDLYLHKQIIESKKTKSVSYDDGMEMMKKSIRNHGSKI